LLVTCAAALQLSAPGHAAEPNGSQWVLEATPYGWAPFLKGSTAINGRVIDIDFTPLDVLKNLESVPFIGYAEARKGPVTLYGDVFYAKLGGSGSVFRARNFGPIGTSVSLNVEGDFEQLVAEAGGAYEIARWSAAGEGAGFVPFTAVEVLAGVRYWNQDLSVGVSVAGAVNVTGLPTSGGRAFARSGSVDWFDPLTGFRVRHAFGAGQELMFRADVGGFAIGSDFSWNVLAAYKFDFAARDGITYAGILGYRLLDVDYSDTSNQVRYEYNVFQHGPVMGISMRF